MLSILTPRGLLSSNPAPQLPVEALPLLTHTPGRATSWVASPILPGRCPSSLRASRLETLCRSGMALHPRRLVAPPATPLPITWLTHLAATGDRLRVHTCPLRPPRLRVSHCPRPLKKPIRVQLLQPTPIGLAVRCLVYAVYNVHLVWDKIVGYALREVIPQGGFRDLRT